MPKTAEAYLLQAMTVPTVREILRCLNDGRSTSIPLITGRAARAALAYYALGDYHEMETESSMMIGSQPANPTGYMLRAMARREIALANSETDLLNQALSDHDRAAGLTAPRDRRRVEICDQRRQTLMRMGRYEQAIDDVQLCLRLQPGEAIHHFHLFCVLTALGRPEEAQAKYDEIIGSNWMTQTRLDRAGGPPRVRQPGRRPVVASAEQHPGRGGVRHHAPGRRAV